MHVNVFLLVLSSKIAVVYLWRCAATSIFSRGSLSAGDVSLPEEITQKCAASLIRPATPAGSVTPAAHLLILAERSLCD
jgi:hypothetical protein